MTQPNDDEIVHQELDRRRGEPAVQVAEVVASLEGEKPDELTPVYDQIDHVLSHLFSDPPAASAQMEITFTYEDYRVTVEQNGEARFVKTA